MPRKGSNPGKKGFFGGYSLEKMGLGRSVLNMLSMGFCRIGPKPVEYSVAPIHRGPLFREIQYIANRPWLPNFPKAKKKKKN